MRTATGAGENLASSFNIAAFNLGNAIGAWAGGIALDAFDLHAVTWVAAISLWPRSVRLQPQRAVRAWQPGTSTHDVAF